MGFLHKLGSHDNWKKRYFVLDSNNELSFYANEQSTEILGRLRIQPKTVCEESEGPAHLGKHFSIQTSLDSKPWNLCAASEAERMVWLESIRNAARSLMTSDLKSGKKKFLDDDLTRKNEESPSKAKSRMHLNINRNRGHGRSRSEDINVNALNEALKARDEDSKRDKKRKSDRKSTKASELLPDNSMPNISVNNTNANNSPMKLAVSSDEIGPMSLQIAPQDRSDDTISEFSDGLPNMGQAAHRTKSANIKIDLKAARRGDPTSKSPRRRMMQSGPLSPTKGLGISSDQIVDSAILPKIIEQVEKPMPVITESDFQTLIEEFKSSDFSDARKQLITSSKQRLTCQQVAEFYDQIDYAEERMTMLSTFIPRIPDLESFEDVVVENILLDAEKEKAREIYKQHQEVLQKQKQDLLVQQQLQQLQQQATQAPSTPVKIQFSPSDPEVHTPSESESRSARSSQSVDAAKRRKPFQGHRRNVSVPLSITSNDSSSNRSTMDGPSDILFEDQDYRIDFNQLRRIESYELDEFIKFLKETPFINKRREGVIKLRRDHLLTCDDLSKILDTLTFGDEKVKAIYLLYDSLLDKDTNIKAVSGRLNFQSEKIKVRELLPIS